MTRLRCLTLAAACLATVLPSPAASARQARADDPIAQIPVLRVQRNVHMLVTPVGNVAAQAGDDGVLLVDSATGALAPQLVAAIRTFSSKPIHTIITTNVHNAAGNLALVQQRGVGATQPVRVIAHEAVLNRLVKAQAAVKAPSGNLRINAVVELPITSAYFTPSRDFYLNGESVVIYHAPAAHTDGDSFVHFRLSDVLAVGDIFSPDRYPSIDIDNGGSVQGVVAALNRILELTVPARFQEGGTFVIPAHGRLSDEADVVEYRDMVTIVRDRVQDSIKKGMTLEQVKAAKPSRDYDAAYDAKGGVTPDSFVEAIYKSLSSRR